MNTNDNEVALADRPKHYMGKLANLCNTSLEASIVEDTLKAFSAGPPDQFIHLMRTLSIVLTASITALTNEHLDAPEAERVEQIKRDFASVHKRRVVLLDAVSDLTSFGHEIIGAFERIDRYNAGADPFARDD